MTLDEVLREFTVAVPDWAREKAGITADTKLDCEASEDAGVIAVYKNLKGLKKENLRDNMTTLELVLNMLAEATTTEISKQKAPGGLRENVEVARSGGKVAGDARKAIEQQTGVPVITSKNAAQLNHVVTNLIEATDEIASKDKSKE